MTTASIPPAAQPAESDPEPERLRIEDGRLEGEQPTTPWVPSGGERVALSALRADAETAVFESAEPDAGRAGSATEPTAASAAASEVMAALGTIEPRGETLSRQLSNLAADLASGEFLRPLIEKRAQRLTDV